MHTFNIKIGSLILTNNKNPELNGRYGRFNHVAITFSATHIVESLENEGVVVNTIDSLIFGPETNEYMILTPLDDNLGKMASDVAYNLAGTKYRFLSSLTRFSQRRITKGLSCISLCREAYKQVIGYDPLWRFPDDVLSSKFFQHSDIYKNV